MSSFGLFSNNTQPTREREEDEGEDGEAGQDVCACWGAGGELYSHVASFF